MTDVTVMIDSGVCTRNMDHLACMSTKQTQCINNQGNQQYWLIDYQLYSNMGNTEDWVTSDSSFKNENDLLSSIIPLEDGQNSNEMLGLGRFKIYRFKTEPYEMIMKHVRIFSPDNPKCQEYSSMAKAIASRVDHKNVARVHSINICTKSSICIKHISIESYVNYYAINLDQVISQRKINDTRFTTGQLWYLLNSLIELSIYLKNSQIFFGVYLAKNIYLSPQGYIKVYLYHLNPQNKHFLYYHMIGCDSRDMHKYLPMPPECLNFMKLKAQELRNVSYEKLEVFGIAMIALEAMLFNSTRRYYSNCSSNQYSLNFDEKLPKKDFRELKEVYPQNLTTLLEKMVKVDPKERMTLQQAKDYIKSIREEISINGAIKMIEDQDNPILPKLSYKGSSKQEQNHNILKSITNNGNSGESRLQFIPLRPVSKEKSNCSSSHYKSLTVSQLGLSIAMPKKENKLHLSNLTAMQSVSRRKESGRPLQQRYLSSFR